MRELLVYNQSNVNELIASLKRSLAVIDNVTHKREKDIDEMIVNLHAASISIKQLSARLDGLLFEEEGDLRASIANIKNITDNAKISIENINKITTDAHEGKGTIGMLISDNETRDRLKGAITGLNNMVERADKLILVLEGDMEYLTRHDSYQGSFSGRLIPADTHYYYFGVGSRAYGRTTRTVTNYRYDNHFDPSQNMDYTETKEQRVTNDLVFSLQYALMFDRLVGLRGGLLDSNIGFGADLYPFRNDNLSLTFEASDFFRETYGAHMKAKIKYAFLNNFFVQAGWDDIGSSRNSFYIGGGVRVVDNDLKYLLGSIPMP
jgi:phospholipid/cholesterol/gamma-HCH transport system substrate-binding protein